MDPLPPRSPRWFETGLRFGCTACGRCCTNHGDYSRVYLREPEAAAIAHHLGLAPEAFLRSHCRREDGWLLLRSDGAACRFLDAAGRCSVYPVRPVQCRTWPFWQEALDPRVWDEEVRAICPGAGTGVLHAADEIEAIAAANEAWYEGDDPAWHGPEPRNA